MLKNYIKIAWRNIWKNKGFSFLNIFGLALGMAVTMLILLMVNHERNMDTFHKDLDQLYVLGNKGKWNDKTEVWFYTPKPLATAIQNNFPEIELTSRLLNSNDLLFSKGENSLIPSGAFIDPNYLEMFSFPLVEGNLATAFSNPMNIVITEATAKKLFGNKKSIVGETIQVNNDQLLTVGGVLKNLPKNTQFDFEYLLPWSLLKRVGGDDNNWKNNSVLTFAKLSEKTTPENFSNKVKDIAKTSTNGNNDNEIIIHKISDWWLRSKFENGEIAGGRIDTVILFTVIALFILLIACINFMNLSTARSEKRAKEIGVRKVAGANRGALIWQFISESVLIAGIAGIIAIGITIITIPYFNSLLKYPISVDIFNSQFWIFTLSIILITGFIAGSYPAFLLSSFKPIAILKGKLQQDKSGFNIRKFLVVFQFSIAIILIISTLIINKQIQYGKDRENGYDKNNLVFLYEEGDIAKNINSIKNDLISENIAQSVTRTFSPFTEGWSNSSSIGWEGKSPDDNTIIDRTYTDGNLIETGGLKLVKGRDIDPKKYPTDSTAMLLNEAAVKAMGFEDPIGKIIKDNNKNWHVVGVVKDFIIRSPFEPISPMIIGGPAGNLSTINIRYNSNLTTTNALSKTKAIFKKYNPNYPFEYHFVDEDYASKFSESQRTGTLSAIFAFFTIFISCLGLLGLAAFLAENRIKEIGIRKVLGASVFSIVRLLSKDFLILIIISCVVAFPIAFWAMDNFLSDYNYRVNLGLDVFVIAGLGAITLTLLTVSSQAIKAALANPVKNIKTE